MGANKPMSVRARSASKSARIGPRLVTDPLLSAPGLLLPYRGGKAGSQTPVKDALGTRAAGAQELRRAAAAAAAASTVWVFDPGVTTGIIRARIEGAALQSWDLHETPGATLDTFLTALRPERDSYWLVERAPYRTEIPGGLEHQLLVYAAAHAIPWHRIAPAEWKPWVRANPHPRMWTAFQAYSAHTRDCLGLLWYWLCCYAGAEFPAMPQKGDTL